MPKSTKRDTIKRLIDASPSAPHWIRNMIIALPKSVKLLKEMVNNPVTQVADVAVKKRSISGMGARREIGSANKNVPTMIRKKKENRIM